MSRRLGPPPEAVGPFHPDSSGAPVAIADRLTPAGLQELAVLRQRRLAMLAANLVLLALVAAAGLYLAAAAGFGLAHLALAACLIAVTPWNTIGFCNAVAGLLLAHRRGGLARAAPFLDPPPEAGDPATGRVAVVMTVRNEAPGRAVARLAAVKADLDATAEAALFDYHLLSDTGDAAIAAAEAEAVARWRAVAGPERIFYRRRPVNAGFKAGNIRDFCAAAGDRYTYFLPLDADSLMGASTILRMRAILEAYPRIGILQSLAVGLPAASAFARLFQFGMRQGMRCYTLGAAWWTGDCGPFWGHNALVRLAPFRRHCTLPELPGPPPLGGAILSHDQVEAVLMRSAGYEVRVLPVEAESFEENPPAVTDFIARDLRWCLGNMQYVKLLARPALLPAAGPGILPGILPMSWFQLAWAVLMFATVPAHVIGLALLPLAALEAQAAAAYPAGLAVALYAGMLALALAPKLAGIADTMLTPGGVARHGGRLRFGLSALLETVFSFLLGPLTALAVSGRLVRLALGLRVDGSWLAQARDGHAVSVAAAARAFGGATGFGLAVTAALAALAPGLLAWAAPVLAGYLLAVPFAVLTADPRLGAFMARHRLCDPPEAFDPPPVLARLERARGGPNQAGAAAAPRASGSGAGDRRES